MVLLPENYNTTHHKLNSLSSHKSSHRGKSIGMSQLGTDCDRKLWLGLHWFAPPEVISGKLQRIFDTGIEAEEFMVRDLERIGIEVTKRQEEIWGFGNYVHGFTDGRCINVPEAPKTEHLLEMKTHNDRSWNGVYKNGVKKSKPLHYAQMQRYMAGLSLSRALYLAYNKNTSAYYSERVKFNPGFAEDLIRKESDIVLSSELPKRKFERHFFQCKFCDFSEFCYDNAPAPKNCRTCKHSDLFGGGTWVCTLNSEAHDVPIEIQQSGCHCHEELVVIR